MILDIPTHIEQGIIQVAKNQGITVNELIIQWLNQAQKQSQTKELDFVGMWANHENSVEEQIQQLRQGRKF